MKEHLGSALPGEAWQAEQTHSLGCSILTAPGGAGYRASFVNKPAASKEPRCPCAPIPARHSGESPAVLPGMEHREASGLWEPCLPSAQAGGLPRGVSLCLEKGRIEQRAGMSLCTPAARGWPGAAPLVPGHAGMALGGAPRMRSRDKKELAGATRHPRGPPATASARARESAGGINAASALRLQSCEGNIMMCETPSCQLPAAGPTLPLE